MQQFQLRLMPVVMLGFLALGLAGCGGGDDSVRSSRGSETESSSGGMDSGATDDRGLVGISEDERAQFLDPSNPLYTRTYYFEYDSDTVSSEYDRPLEAHANFLKKHPELTIRLEGHADERGSREYNIALGERRSAAIKRVLVLKGVSEERVTVLSYGEERPAVEGHDEEAWAKNRRVEMVYPRQ